MERMIAVGHGHGHDHGHDHDGDHDGEQEGHDQDHDDHCRVWRSGTRVRKERLAPSQL
jgi:hypothetical protein